MSGKPDGFDFVFEFKSPSKEDNRLTICCPLYREAKLNFAYSLASRTISTDFFRVYNPAKS